MRYKSLRMFQLYRCINNSLFAYYLHVRYTSWTLIYSPKLWFLGFNVVMNTLSHLFEIFLLRIHPVHNCTIRLTSSYSQDIALARAKI